MGVRPAGLPATRGAAGLALAFSILLPAWAALAIVLRSAPAAAQTPAADEEQLPDTEPGRAERRRLPTARVTAVRPEELPDDPSSFSTVIQADRFQGEAETVERLLDDSVGVQVRSFGGPGQPSEVSIRGSSGQQVVVQLDGVRLNTAQTGTVDLSTLPLVLVDRIEVSRGGGSAQVGSGAIGGVVNVITRRPSGKPESAASFSGGSFDTWQGSVSHANRVGLVDVALSYAGFRTEGDWDFQSSELRLQGQTSSPSTELERVNNDSESHSVLFQAGADLAPGLRLRVWDSFYYQSRGQPGPDFDPQAPGGGQSTTAHERTSRNVAAMTLETDGWEVLPESVGFTSTVSYLFEETRFREPEPRGLQDPIATRQKNRTGTWRSAGTWEGRGLGIEHAARLGFQLRYDSLSSNDEGFQRRFGQSVSLGDELSFWRRRLQLIPTLRLDHDNDFGSEWVPHVGAIVSPWPWLRFKGNVERSYRTPDFDELFFPDKGFIRGNPSLRPEEAWNYDAGIEIAFAELSFVDDLRIQAAWFLQDVEDSIVFQRVSPTTVAATNTGDAEIDGFELAGSLSLFGWIRFSANWTHQDGELDRRTRVPPPDSLFPPIGTSAGTAIPGQADDEYVLRLRVGPESGLFKLVAVRRYTSRIAVSFSDTATIGSRTLYDLSGVLDLAQVWRPKSRWAPKQLLVSASVTNLTDESVRDSVGFPQPGRLLAFGMEARW